MEQRPGYESLIAGKLETLPVPDMADAIWARIEAQLDIDLPTGDGGNDAAPQSPSGPGAFGWGLSIFIVALLTTFLLYKNNRQTTQPVPKNLPSTIQQSQPTSKETQPSPPTRTDARPTVTTPKKTPATGSSPQPDSIVQQPVVAAPLKVPDSIQTISEPVVVTSAPKDTATSVKKRRGVSGIKDEDYRIVPAKRDSS